MYGGIFSFRCLFQFILFLNTAAFLTEIYTAKIRLSLGAKGFGASGSKEPNRKREKKARTLQDSLEDKPKQKSQNTPFVRSEQDQLLEKLKADSSKSCIGKAVASSLLANDPDADPFWELMPSLISSRFPNVKDSQLERVAGFIRHTLDPNLSLEDDIINDKWRPHDEIHAYMPGLGKTQPFYDPHQLELCRLLSENYEIIRQEYDALVDDMERTGKDRFQSVTSMNYDAGWRTMVLYYNGHLIEKFPYHLCPTTLKILQTVPIAGRIAGFNRQMPMSGIPLHSDGNNMWLTCQMGIYVPEGEKAWIRVGPETKNWKAGECLLYDTTYEHETFNGHSEQERVVLHVDFYNTLALTPVEIEVMQYIYSIRETFMKAEGVSKVEKQIL